MDRIRILICIFALAACLPARGQYQSPPRWSFGHHAGLDFTSGNPVPFPTAINTHSAVSSTQCDDQGNVLFYANSYRIWDAQGSEMPGSINPVWNTSYISSWNLHAMIIPDPADSNRYFVFQTFPSKGNPPYGPYFMGQLTYSIVDMTLNNGLGDVVSGFNHVLLDINIGHMLAVIPGNHCNYWVVTQFLVTGSSRFKCYEVSAAGLNPVPVVSDFAGVNTQLPGHSGIIFPRAGEMIYSYSRNKIIATYESADLVSYDINPSSGVVSNPVSLAWAYPQGQTNSATLPAICLSPDEKLLYVSGSASTTNGYELRQFPVIDNAGGITLGQPQVIFSTSGPQFLGVQQSTGFAWLDPAMQKGPDGKIYHAFTMGQPFLGVINQPDIPGTACDFDPQAVQLSPGSFTTSALPAPMFTRRKTEYVAGQTIDTTVCFLPSVTLHAPDTSFQYYAWSNGQDGPETEVSISGTYVLNSGDGSCRIRQDSFLVTMTNHFLTLDNDITTCDPVTIYANTNATGPLSYLWQDNSTGPSMMVQEPGTYWVEMQAAGCVRRDSIDVNAGTLDIDLPGDTTLCNGKSIMLHAIPTEYVYTWSDSSHGEELSVSQGGTYWVEGVQGFCKGSDTINIAAVNCENCLLGMPSVFSPNGDGKNDVFKPLISPVCNLEEYRFNIYNRFGELVFTTIRQQEGWDGFYKQKASPSGTYMYYVQFKAGNGEKLLHSGDVTLVR